MRQHLSSAPRRLLPWAALPLLAVLGGCDLVVMNPTGDVAVQQRNIILISTALMLLIIVPVMIATVVFAWRYRAGNASNGRTARYDPEFDHSTPLELMIWSAPLLIIICLGALTWSSTHLLDPWRPLERITPGQRVAAGTKPLEVQVVAMDWKWLFIYPQQGIATVNELALPVNVPVHFTLTSSTQMNAFYAPTLAGMIYAMPGMETTLHAVLNKPGESAGFGSNYTGRGFADMRFALHGLAPADFNAWVGRVKGAGGSLQTANFIALDKPSEKVPVIRYAAVAPNLFARAVNRCVEPGKPCMADVMKRDREAGGGRPGSVRAGEGNPPVNEAAPMHGEKPTPALMKTPEEKGSGPNVTAPRKTETPGGRKPGAPGNRDMSFLTPFHVPGAASAARA